MPRSAAPDLGEWDSAPDPVADPVAVPAARPAQLHCRSLDEFVCDKLVATYRRRVGLRGARRSAADWWRSAEAISRLEALWRSWEHLRHDPAVGMSMSWRDHADYYKAALVDPDGPFASSADEKPRRREPRRRTAPARRPAARTIRPTHLTTSRRVSPSQGRAGSPNSIENALALVSASPGV